MAQQTSAEQTVHPARNGTPKQIVRYAVAGLASNLLLYVFYLVLTSLGLQPKLAMTIVYVVGTLATFFLHGAWSFATSPLRAAALARYITAYALGYLLNLGLLWLLVDRMGWPHRAVQGGAILVVAACLFMLNKYWVFAPTRERLQ